MNSRFPGFARAGWEAKLCAMSLLRCFSSLGCPELSLEQTLAVAQRHGVGAVELRTLGGSADLPGYFTAQYADPAQLKDALRKSAVQVASLNASFALVGATAAQRDELIAIAHWADAAGIPRVRVFDGGKGANAQELAEATETMRWWSELRRAHGWRVELMVETHSSLFTRAALERFTRALPDVAILWDAHHTWRKGGEDPVGVWRALRSRIVHVHIKDSIAVASARHPYTYVLPGDGGFPAQPLLAALRVDGFHGPVSLEWEKFWHPYLPPLETALATAERRWWAERG